MAPKITTVKSVVVRRSDPDVYGQRHFEALVAGTYQKANLVRVNWREAMAPEIVEQAADEVMWDLRGRPPDLRPLSLDEQPELATFIDALPGETN